MSGNYQLVRLRNGAHSVRALAEGEVFHPGLGPVAEAEALYARQLRLVERARSAADEFILWDVGLGAAANALCALRALSAVPGKIRLASFDHTDAPLAFARQNAAALGYFSGYETHVDALLREKIVTFQNGQSRVTWQFYLGDFPAWLAQATATASPHAILYDAFSPAKNPAMWTLPVFERLFQRLDSTRPCALTTFSRSTLVRVTLLLAGFYAGTGSATGLKEETTIAANTLDLIANPLDSRWLERALRSPCAEPLREPVYTRARLTAATRSQLLRHPLFQIDGPKIS